MKRILGGGYLPHPPQAYEILRGILGGVTGITAISYLGMFSGVPWIIAPFGATCVLLFAAPQTPLAQPRNVIFGHLIAAFCGLLFINVLGNTPFFMAIAVGMAIAAMQILRVTHAPAGANPIIIFMANIHDWNFMITPVLVGSVTLVLVALIINNIRSTDKYPVYWRGTCPKKKEDLLKE
ncbi:putative HPP family protein [Shimwellia blattae DSM 4481 = NBRC 105725]|uniref:Putative HPP family protein n=2 Tax=Shimwellia blattae TaxID=563 RepID=I2BCC6_SHIBC|nr:putative HPP family protein [Shimwellia blattae DSM 4481 = NBRC 105725]GAB82740.1 hypothetical protein EB105725_33_00200 [Shimwellia blattae DSM 4481 = NBRC 105725]VDY65677.1 HPP family [Shimwellia blattae]VEC25333.1 HPP family [Shimwellia blattae]